MSRRKTNEEVSQKLEKQKKVRAAAAEEICYVDSNRNISVNLSESELSKALKDFEQDVNIAISSTKFLFDLFFQNSDEDEIVNSTMFTREAHYYRSRKQYGLAMEKLQLGWNE